MVHKYKYCTSLINYTRRESRVVNIGDVPLGGDHPIRIQSMTTANTMDTAATAAEAIRIIESGCDYVRITAPSIREAENLKNIKDALHKKGYRQPLIADIHFTPHAAEIAAKIVEKVRINPGNYADRKRFKVMEYTDESYNDELERIYDRFSPLVKVCKEYGTAMRIGTNHGSLSDRILSRYGDTPLGMVESAMEFIRICEVHNYYDIVLSMKSSNPLIMVEAYRLLVNKMDSEGMNYPIHLGVTEAGEGEEGRIKSAMGIGTLLEDGIGDTIRVSLTEPPEFEAQVARRILKRYIHRSNGKIKQREITSPVNPFAYHRRQTYRVENIGGKEVPRVIADFHDRTPEYEDFAAVGYHYHPETDKWNIDDIAADYVYIGSKEININLDQRIGLIYDYKFWTRLKHKNNSYPLYTLKEYRHCIKSSYRLKFVLVNLSGFDVSLIKNLAKSVLVLDDDKSHTMADFRKAVFELMENDIEIPVIIKREYTELDDEDFQLYSAIDIGGLLVDGLGDGIWLGPASALSNRTGFGILHASRTRISKTEYISCPSCGRTLFDIQETSAGIRKRTSHLKGIKIGIMGCIVNGPGEMADADYGYVGTGIGKISLYRGQKLVKQNIPAEQAVNALIKLIKEDGKWVDAK